MDGEPGGLPSMGSHRVGHDWSDLAAAAPYYVYLWSIHLSLSFLELVIWVKGKTIQTQFIGNGDRASNPLLFFQTLEHEGRYYECDVLPFMEIGSVAHKYYLLNIRLPVNEKKKINVGIGEIKDIRLVVSESDWSQLWYRFLQFVFLVGKEV